MSQQYVPLTNAPNQQIKVTLNVDGKTVNRTLLLSFNEIAPYWVLAILDSGGNPLLSSIPLVGGEAPAGNLLAQFAYLGLGGITILNASGASDDWPSNTELGVDWILVWYDSQES